MKYVKYVLAYMVAMFLFTAAGVSLADQRIDYNETGCHFVTPAGIETDDNGHEVKASGCPGDIITNADDTRNGYVTNHLRAYPFDGMPVTSDYTYASEGGTIACNLADGNNTYTTNDFSVSYIIPELADFKVAYRSGVGDVNYNPDFDYDESGFINTIDLVFFKQTHNEVSWSFQCYNAALVQ